MNLIDLLGISGVDVNKRIKIIRHSHKDERVLALFAANRDLLEQYQALQDYKALHCDFVVSCLKDKNNKTVVQAVYQVMDHRPATESDIPNSADFNHLLDIEEISAEEFTLLKRVEAFSSLEQRVVIDWGKAAIKWLQSLNNNPKNIIEIKAQGKVEEFLTYDSVLLGYQQLKQMINYPEANQEWHQMLSVNGVYLMINNKTGQQYVGSAYGKEGILGRWRDYAKNGHGGNVRLQRLLATDPSLLYEMQYSILTTVASNKTSTEIIAIENFYKQKLGRAAVTLNHEGHELESIQQERRKIVFNVFRQFLNINCSCNDLPFGSHHTIVLQNGDTLSYSFIPQTDNPDTLVSRWQQASNVLHLEFDIDGHRLHLTADEYLQRMSIHAGLAVAQASGVQPL